jgi:hypothetical protein
MQLWVWGNSAASVPYMLLFCCWLLAVKAAPEMLMKRKRGYLLAHWQDLKCINGDVAWALLTSWNRLRFFT